MKPASWSLAVVLTFAYVLSFVDRQVVNLLLEGIKTDLRINDTQASLLVGTAFAVFFVVAGLPLGWLADRINRRNLVAAAISAWTVATAACGFAGSFGALFAGRVGVGVGEAGLTPAALSMIGDAYPPERRGLAIGLFSSGVSIGMGAALLGGGALMAAAPTLVHVLAPVFGPMRPWQVVFLMVSLPGLLVVPLVLMQREPPRLLPKQGAPELGPILTFLRARAGVYLGIVGGVSALTVMGYGFGGWLPTLFIRVHHWSAAKIGLDYGALLLVFGLTGSVLAGWLCDRGMARGVIGVHWTVLAVCLPLLGLFYVLIASQKDAGVAFALLAPAALVGAAPTTAGYGALLQITPPPFRARVFAGTSLIQSVIGLTVGPTSIGLMNDYVFRSPLMIGASMTVLAAAAAIVGTLSVLSCRRGYRRLAAA